MPDANWLPMTPDNLGELAGLEMLTGMHRPAARVPFVES